MAGISSKALKVNYIQNKYQYNGKELQNKEFNDGSGVEWYDYGMREYDAQIGRFFRIDPITEHYFQLTPYQYASNDPVANIDLDGNEGRGSVSGSDSKEQKQSNPQAVQDFMKGYKDGFTNHFAKLSAQAKYFRENPKEAIKYGLNQVYNPLQILKNIWHVSLLNSLIDNTKVSKNFIGNLINGKFYGAGRIAGDKGANAAVQVGVMIVTAGAAKGTIIAKNIVVEEGAVAQALGARFVTEVEATSHGEVLVKGTVDLQPTFDRIATGNVGKQISKNDGTTYRNDDGSLPMEDGVTYTEYNVATPETKGAGPMRLIVGSDGTAWFTSDHYNSFVQVR